MISLATRGYLCPGALLPQSGDGPPIVDVKDLIPAITGTADQTPAGPSITGGGLSAPSITGSASQATPPPGEPPSIVGGGPLIPGLNSDEEE